MSNDYREASFKKLLTKLQEESWQLELIISGFAIYGLFTAFPEITLAMKTAQKDDNILKFIVLIVSQVSCAILIFNLILHVLLRGLWIGALGLRYVSGDIDYDNLKYSEKFTNFLRKRVGSFDKYIANLENYCSVIFAISFLLIFYVISFTLIIGAIALTSIYLIDDDYIKADWGRFVGIPLLLFIIFGMFFVFIDLITQGGLKRKRWTSKLYFPVYRVFSIITLSFLYRPLVYNFLDNKFTRKLSLILLPFYIGILLLTSFQNERSNYLQFRDWGSEQQTSLKNYENFITNKGEFIYNAAIPSKVIETDYLRLFVVYSDNTEDRVFRRNPSLKPEKDRRGIRSTITFSSGMRFWEIDSIKTEYLKTFNKMHRIMIDSTEIDFEFILGRSHTPEKEQGFETYLNISDLEKGMHLLRVQNDRIKDGDTLYNNIATIPFWYFPNQ